MNKQTAKRGFTITELVIVIAVIAILAAVLIPTFVSLVDKANQSADIQAARQMNTALQADSALQKPGTIGDVGYILMDAGFEIGALKPVTATYTFNWCSQENVIMLIDTKTNTVVYPENAQGCTAHAATYLVNLDDARKNISVDASTSKDAENALQNGSDLNLKNDVEIKDTVSVQEEMTLNLNGKDFDASANDARPLELTDNSKLVINAEGSTITLGQYGLVNVPTGFSGEIVINGGTIVGTLNNGAFIKLRGGDGNVKITLNNVTYNETSADSFIVHSAGVTKNLELVVNGGSYKAQAGFMVSGGSVKIDGATIETKGFALQFDNACSAEITNCTIKTGDAKVSNAPAAGVAVSNGGSVTVTNSSITTGGKCFYVYNSGGTIVANNNTCANTWKIDKAGSTITINGTTHTGVAQG